MKHFIEHDSQTPHIQFLAVDSALQNFGRHVLVGAANLSFESFLLGRGAPPEVAKLDLEVRVQQNVFGFDVSMEVVFLVQILHCEGSLVKEPKRQAFGKAFFGVDVEEETSVAGVLQEKVDHVFLLKGVVEFDDVWVVETLM